MATQERPAWPYRKGPGTWASDLGQGPGPGTWARDMGQGPRPGTWARVPLGVPKVFLGGPKGPLGPQDFRGR